jgi:catechol 2,3-dioxygenase-like lactoylglutathione lyase family enzyme
MLKDTQAFSGFAVDDLDRAREFYGQTLGLELDEEGPGLGLKLGGGGTVFVYPKRDHEPAGFTILNFPVDDIDSAVGALRERGVEFERYEGTPIETDESGIFRGGHGPPIAWFTDPAGNVLAVIERS